MSHYTKAVWNMKKINSNLDNVNSIINSVGDLRQRRSNRISLPGALIIAQLQ